MITTTDFFIGLNRLNLEDYPEIERHTKLMSNVKVLLLKIYLPAQEF